MNIEKLKESAREMLVEKGLRGLADHGLTASLMAEFATSIGIEVFNLMDGENDSVVVTYIREVGDDSLKMDMEGLISESLEYLLGLGALDGGETDSNFYALVQELDRRIASKGIRSPRVSSLTLDDSDFEPSEEEE